MGLYYGQGIKKMNPTLEPETWPVPEIGDAPKGARSISLLGYVDASAFLMSQNSTSTDNYDFSMEYADWGVSPNMTVQAVEDNETLLKAIRKEVLEDVKSGQKNHKEFEEDFKKNKKNNEWLANSTADYDKRLEHALSLYYHIENGMFKYKVEEGDAYLKREFGFEVPKNWSLRDRILKLHRATDVNGLAGMTAAMDIGNMGQYNRASDIYLEIERPEELKAELYAEKSVG